MNTGDTESRELARRAERLLRALTGVLDARVETGPRGITAVHVTAEPGDREETTRNVRSALLAGLALAVEPGRVVITTAAPSPNGNGRELQAEGGRRKAEGGRGYGEGDGEGNHEGYGEGEGDERHEGDEGDARAGPRLVAVELEERRGGRVTCRVSVVVAHRLHQAAVEAPDMPGGGEHAAAEAATRALRAGGLHAALSGVRRIDIAGIGYVVVALRTDTGAGPVHRAAAAPLAGSATRAAADATVRAARQLPRSRAARPEPIP